MTTDDVVLLCVYPKRGPQGTVDLVDEEYDRLLMEMVHESQAKSLHQVDIANLLAELSTEGTLHKQPEE